MRPKQQIEIPPLDARAIGRRIRAARKALGWSLSDFSRVTGLAVGTVAAFECGARVPRLDSAIRMALALRRKLDWLVRGKGRRKEIGGA
jgi:transcriptional regulator with XRE-family HTH domain